MWYPQCVKYLLCLTNRFYFKFSHGLAVWLSRNHIISLDFYFLSGVMYRNDLFVFSRKFQGYWVDGCDPGNEARSLDQRIHLQHSTILTLPCCQCPEDFALMLITSSFFLVSLASLALYKLCVCRGVGCFSLSEITDAQKKYYGLYSTFNKVQIKSNLI